MSLGPNNKDQMHPEDIRNLFIFFALSILLWMGFNHFILEPQKQAMKKVQEARIEAAAEQSDMEEQEAVILPRAEAIGQTRRVEIDNGQIFGSLSLTGARLDDLSLREYFDTLEKENNVVIFSPRKTEAPCYIDYGWVAAKYGISLPDADTPWRLRGNDKLTPENPVTLYWNNGQGLLFERTISLDKDFLFTITQKVTNSSSQKVTLYPYGLISQKGMPKDFQGTWIQYEGPMGFVNETLIQADYQDLRKKGSQTVRANSGWAGINQKYWLSAFVPPQGQRMKYKFDYTGDVKGEKLSGRFQVDFVGEAVELAPGKSATTESHIFAGPKQLLKLEEYGEALDVPRFDLAVDFGWFWFLSKPFFYALHFLGEFTGNLGVAIILLTVVIRGSVFPLTNASYRSFAKMKLVTPQVAALRDKYGDDKQKLQGELVELYQREGVNPMAGCIPILLQIPIFFALYKVLYVTIEVRHAPFIGWIEDLSVRDPTNIFNLFGLIPWDPPGFLHVGIWPLFMLVAMIIQRKLNPPPQDQLQRDMMRYFPFIITYVLSNFASGLVIYWAFSAWIGLAQQMLIMRMLGVPIHLFGETEEEEALEKAATKGADVHPLAEMVEDDVEEALFGDDDKPKEITPPKPKKKKKKKK